jgi:hypothetical protein
MRLTAILAAAIVASAAAAAQPDSVVLDNPYARVSKNAAPCAKAGTPGCDDRIVVAMGPAELSAEGKTRTMGRGDIAVFTSTQSYAPPTGGPYFEVVLKANHPPVQSPREIIPPEKNSIRHDGKTFFVFEERLERGDTRSRHSHSQRVVIQLNKTRLHYTFDNEPEAVRDITPDGAGFNPPVIHTVKNVGELPLRGIVIEFKPATKR